MHKVSTLAALFLALGATVAGGAGINLSLNDCGPLGGVNAIPSCGTNAGIAMSMVGSVIPPAGINRLVGMEGTLDVRTQGGAISSWWQLDGCRASALLFNFDFSAGPNSCVDFWAGQASGGGGISPVHAAPDRFQIKLVCATVGENAIDPGAESYLFKVNILRTKSTGAGSCAGCNDGACFVLSKVVLTQPAGFGDYTLTEAANRNWVTYNASPDLGDCPGATPPPPPAVPLAPELATPANHATGVASDPVLAWNASAGADSYRLQVSTGVAFGSPVVDQAGITTTSSAVSSLAANTTYYWHVNATNGGGTSGYSATWSFTTALPPPPPAPVLAAPADGATGVSATTPLAWNPAAGATSYRLQVATDPGFANLIVNQGGLTSTSSVQYSYASNTTYYWHVSASNAGGTSDYSTTWSFTTAAAPPPVVPAAPTLVVPLNGTTGMPTNPTLIWNPSAGANSYRLQVATSETFTAPLVADQAGLTMTSTSLSGLAGGTTYYWRVNATGEGGTSPFSPIWRFTTSDPTPPPPTAPAVPVLLSPVNGATGVTTYPTLAWIASSGATWYGLQLSAEPAFASPVVNQAVTGTSFPVPSALAANTTYYWHVSANNSAGTSGYSPTSVFMTGDAAPPPPPPPSGPGYLNLSLNDCSLLGLQGVPATCTSDTGLAMRLIGSVVPPANLDHVVGCEAYIDVQTVASTLSPWWTLDGCRTGSLTFNFDFTSGFGSCHDFWAGQASGGGGISPVHTAPNRFQIKLVCATVAANPMDPEQENYLFQANINRAKSTGTNACAGCGEEACFVMNRLVLVQPAGWGDCTVTEPLMFNWVRYAGGGGIPGCSGTFTPVRHSSWGQVKALFR